MSDEINQNQENEEVEEQANPSHRWYVINAIIGQERKVAKAIQQEIAHKKMESLISQVIIPAEKVMEIKRGQKVYVEKKACPGYIIVCMEMNSKTWNLIRNIQGVSRFIEKERRPVPVPEHQIKEMLEHLENVSDANQQIKHAEYLQGDIVQIVDGAFEGFSAVVESVDQEKSRMKVLVSIFGRETPIEIDFKQASK